MAGPPPQSYLSAPVGSPHCYRQKVLEVKPDLIVSEFVNDSWMNRHDFEKIYSGFRDDFKAIGAEWILIAPHCIHERAREDAAGQKYIDNDPREYIHCLREFAEINQIPCADVAARYRRLWRQGIPYLTLMTNFINHPNRAGWQIFAESLMDLFPLR